MQALVVTVVENQSLQEPSALVGNICSGRKTGPSNPTSCRKAMFPLHSADISLILSTRFKGRTDVVQLNPSLSPDPAYLLNKYVPLRMLLQMSIRGGWRAGGPSVMGSLAVLSVG